MPKEAKWPNVQKQTNRHGVNYYYHRPTGKRIRGEYESAEWILHYKELEKRKPVTLNNIKPGTVDHLIAYYKENFKGYVLKTLAEETITWYDAKLFALHELIGDMDVEDIDFDVVNTLHINYARQENNRTGDMRKCGSDGLIRVLRMIYNFGQKSHKHFPQIEHRRNPCADFTPLWKGGYGYRKWPGFLVDAYINELPASYEPIRRLIVHMYYTGQRTQDVFDLQWSAYDGRTLTFFIKKTTQSDGNDDDLFAIPLHKSFKKEMDMWRETNPTGLYNIHMSLRGQPWTLGNLRQRFQNARKIMSRNPTVLEHQRQNRNFDIYNYSLHGLRKNACVRLFEINLSYEEISTLTGQSVAMVKKYCEEASRLVKANNAIKKLEQNDDIHIQ